MAAAAPRAPLGVPVWNPFLNLRATVLRYLMRPVPVVFLRLAFSDQLSVRHRVSYVLSWVYPLPVVVRHGCSGSR